MRFTAEIYFLLESEGGRRRVAAFSGYRPSFVFDASAADGQTHLDGEITVHGREHVDPGETVSVQVRLLHPELLEHAITAGKRFTVTEGGRLIGRGKVASID